jgi:subtilisin family serine protease
MLSIASTFKNTESSNIELSNFSNFGRRTVDIAANGENLPFYWSSTANNTPVSGTSFSCPKITALAGSLYTQGASILDWRNNVIGATTYSENLHQIKYSSFLEE